MRISLASIAAGRGQCCRSRPNIRGSRDRPADDKQVCSIRERLLRGRGPTLVIDRDACRPHTWRDEHDVVSNGSPDRRHLARGTDDSAGARTRCKNREPHGRIEG